MKRTKDERSNRRQLTMVAWQFDRHGLRILCASTSTSTQTLKVVTSNLSIIFLLNQVHPSSEKCIFIVKF